MKELKDRDVLQYLRSRVGDATNRLADKHVDIIERRLKEDRLELPEVLAEPEAKKSSLITLKRVGIAIAILGLLISGQLDLVALIELAASYAIN